MDNGRAHVAVIDTMLRPAAYQYRHQLEPDLFQAY